MILITSQNLAIWGTVALAWRAWNVLRFDGSIMNIGEGEGRNSTYHIDETKKNIKDAAVNLGQATREATEAAKEKTEEAAEWTRDKAKDAMDWTKMKAHDAAEWTKAKVKDIRGTSSDIFTRIRQRITDDKLKTEEIAEDPNVQMRVLPNQYLLVINIPGVPLSSLHVQIARNQLLIFGDHEECITHGEKRVCWERSVEEVFDLPEDVEQDGVESWMHLQVLVVRMPRKSLEEERVVKIGQKGTIDKILERVGLDEKA